MIAKQCPNCGFLNPLNNSRCVGCKIELVEPVPIPEVKLEDNGYQPALTPDEVMFFCGISSLIAIAAMNSYAQADKLIPPDKKRYMEEAMRRTMVFVLRNRLGRTPTRDEVESMLCGMDGERIPEGLARIQRLFDEGTSDTPLTEAQTAEVLAGVELRDMAYECYRIANEYLSRRQS